MATTPNLVVAGDPSVAGKLRETGRFPAVFDVASAAELRTLSRSGRVGRPAAFMFAPGFIEDLPGAGVSVLANGLAGNGFTVLVHDHFKKRGDEFGSGVCVTGGRVRLSELLTMLGATRKPDGMTAAEPHAVHTAATPRGAGAAAAKPSMPDLRVAGAAAAKPSMPDLRVAGAAAAKPSMPDLRVAGAAAAKPSMPDLRVAGAATAEPSRPAASLAWPARRPVAAETPESAGRRGKVIAVTAAKGGVGKTSMAVNLAVYAARLLQAVDRAGTVALVDTNFQQADVGRYLSLDSPTILDVFQHPGALNPQALRGHMARIAEIDLYALLGPPDIVAADPAVINAKLYQRIIAALRDAFDFVFVDTPVAELYHTTFTELVLPEADAILVPVEPNRVTLEAAQAWLRAITLPQHSRDGRVDPRKLSLVLNRARGDVDCGPEDVMDLLSGWRLVGVIPDDEEWMQAVNEHRLVGMHVGSGLDETFREILQAVTGETAFGTATLDPPGNGRAHRWKKVLGLNRV
ncbi:CpaE family protein [Actinomadura sp. SCN-SB]|uniref:AAA family ATPase n=1 Tax=Actinomadura sp. SCN-SB TaxID=3373092 RepID=UPI003753522B